MTAPARVLPLRSPLVEPVPKRSHPLRLVPQRRSKAAKTPFVVVVVVLLVGGLLGLLLLNTLVAQESFALHDLSTKGKALTQQEQDLARQVQGLQAPASLADRAVALGMVQGGPPAFLRLSDGKVLGKPEAGALPTPPAAATPTVSTAPTTAATTGKAPTGSTTWTAPKPGTKPTTKPTTRTSAKPTTKQPAKKPTHATTGAHR